MKSKPPFFLTKARAPWADENFYFKGDDYFKDVLKAIRGSKRRVDFEVYIFEKGILADRVADALLQASGRGVKVRLLVDGIGSPSAFADYSKKLKEGGVQFRVYRYLPSILGWFPGLFGSLAQGKTTFRLKHFWIRFNRRNHRKLVMVDGDKVWLGGFNVSDEHLEEVSGKKAWRDTGLGLSGVRDRAFSLAFNTAWHDKNHRELWRRERRRLIAWLSRKSFSDPVHINATHQLRQRYYRDVLDRLRGVRRRIWVTTPYFVPTRVLLRALLQAALDGRDVRLVLPEKSDIPFVRWASMTYFPRLLKAGCRIFEYHKSVLHAKTLVVDNWAMVGSSNFNHRSFLFDLEVDVVARHSSSLKSLERQYASDFKQSREIHFSDLKRRSLWARCLTWIFFHARYWF